MSRQKKLNSVSNSRHIIRGEDASHWRSPVRASIVTHACWQTCLWHIVELKVAIACSRCSCTAPVWVLRVDRYFLHRTAVAVLFDVCITEPIGSCCWCQRTNASNKSPRAPLRWPRGGLAIDARDAHEADDQVLEPCERRTHKRSSKVSVGPALGSELLSQHTSFRCRRRFVMSLRGDVTG